MSLVFDRPERVNPGEQPARYKPKRVAATVTGYWQAIPLMRRTITIAGVDVVPWLVYCDDGQLDDHPGDCGEPRPTRHSDGTWDHAPALVRIHRYCQANPDSELAVLTEGLQEHEVAVGIYRHILRQCWSGMDVVIREE